MSPYLDPCKNGHLHEVRGDGWVYCRKCNKRLFKAPKDPRKPGR